MPTTAPELRTISSPQTDRAVAPGTRWHAWLVVAVLNGCGGESSSGPIDAATPDTSTASDAPAEIVADAPSDPPSRPCDPASTALPPIGTDDVTYDAHKTYLCLADKPLLCRDSPMHKTLEGLLRCEAVEGGYFWGQGSLAFRVVGRAGGQCVLDVLRDLEGGGEILRCTLPLPTRAWDGLSSAVNGGTPDQFLLGIETHCTRVRGCSLLGEAPDQCWDVVPRPPLCEDFAYRGGLPDP